MELTIINVQFQKYLIASFLDISKKNSVIISQESYQVVKCLREVFLKLD